TNDNSLICKDALFSSRRRHTISKRDWSSDVCSSDLPRPKKGHAYMLTIDPQMRSEQILRETGILLVREGNNYISDGIYSSLVKKIGRASCRERVEKTSVAELE